MNAIKIQNFFLNYLTSFPNFTFPMIYEVLSMKQFFPNSGKKVLNFLILFIFVKMTSKIIIVILYKK
jgi:hypothetical protein